MNAIGILAAEQKRGNFATLASQVLGLVKTCRSFAPACTLPSLQVEKRVVLRFARTGPICGFNRSAGRSSCCVPRIPVPLPPDPLSVKA